MTRQEFEQLQRRPCDRCAGGVSIERNPNNNALQVVCGKCGARVPWRDHGVVNLKQNGKRRRADYPMGEELDEVWARYDDACIVCGATTDELKAWGVGRQRQHVAEYRTDMHRGPILPICTDCHPFATQLQKMRALLRHSQLNGHTPSP
jgi:hypothetical protein